MFQKTFDFKQNRREREQNVLDLRRYNREYILKKKRKINIITNHDNINDINLLKDLCYNIKNRNNLNHKIESTMELRYILSNMDMIGIQNVIDKVMETGIYRDILKNMEQYSQNEELKLESLWVLANLLASQKQSHIVTLVALKLIPILIGMFDECGLDVKSVCLLGISNIACTNYAFANMIMDVC